MRLLKGKFTMTHFYSGFFFGISIGTSARGLAEKSS